ncbi:MAG: hypothetical protein LBL65_08000 [Campylobacteraceae bacterium]|jgi:hypothetical protein|nr:hypothetical protein [Campylobacteraceae bacterium]
MKRKYGDIILRVIFYILLTLLVLLVFLVFLPSYFSCGGNHELSESEYKEMIEQAKQGNIIAMDKLGWHYLSTKTGMYMFYQYKSYETQYFLSNDKYKQLSEYVKAGNETAKEKLEKYQLYLDKKKELQDFLDGITILRQFVQICSEDDFCNHSDIYKYYSQKADNMSENKTQ